MDVLLLQALEPVLWKMGISRTKVGPEPYRQGNVKRNKALEIER